MKERIRLKSIHEELNSLLPGEEFKIGSDSITIRPLTLFQYKTITGKFKLLIDECVDKGITAENYRETDKFLFIAEIILTKFPDLLEEISNISAEDLQQLPIEIVVSLIDKCLEVNLKSKDVLMGNFKSLAGRINMQGLLK